MTEKDPAKHEKYENKQKVNRQHARRAIVGVLYFIWFLSPLHDGNVL